MSNKIIGILLISVIIVVFYFSWLSDPSFANETYLPKWLVNWSSHYHNLRTAIPFVPFGYLLGIYTKNETFNKVLLNKKLIFVQNIFIAATVATVAEGGQFLLARRSPDIMDVFFGAAGSLAGSILYNLFTMLRNEK